MAYSRKSLALLILALRLPCLGQTVFRTGASLVQVDVQVLKDRRPVTGLTRDDFDLRDNGEVRRIEAVGSDAEPLDVVLLLDVSGSMRKTVAELAAGAHAALAQLLDGDRAAVVAFTDHQWMVQPLTTDFDAVGAAIQKVAVSPIDGATDLLGAIEGTARYLETNGRSDGRRAIVMVTDNIGALQGSDRQGIETLWSAGVVLNAVITPTPFDPKLLPPEWRPSKRELADIRPSVGESGGEIVPWNPEGGTDLRDLFERVRRRYSLYFKPSAGTPGQLRTIEVRLSKEARKRYGKVQVRARRGYAL